MLQETSKQTVVETLGDARERIESGKPVAVFAVVAGPATGNDRNVRFVLYQQGDYGMGAAVAIAVGDNAAKIFGEFDKWMRKAGYVPDAK